MPKHEQPPIDRQLIAQPSDDAATIPLPQATQQAKDAYQRGDWPEAERLCRLILNGRSNQFEALNLLGIIAAQTQRPQQAIELLSKAVAVNPDHATAHSNLGNVLCDLQRHKEALESFNCALKLNPDDADTHYKRSSILGVLKRYDEALESCNNALKIRPDYAEALNNRGNALGCLKHPEDALESFQRALEIKPDYAEALNNRGAVLRSLKRLNEALESYNRALTIAPNYAEASYNRGIVLSELERPREAIEAYEHALTIKADYVGAHWNLSLCRLQLGDFSRGWEGYEWRWKEEQLEKSKRDFPQPMWLGVESLEGKTILLHGEAGLGDTLQFCRYAKQVAALGAKVVLEVQAPLLPLLTNLEGALQVLAQGSALPAFDYHCPLLSLPLAFKTEVNSIPTGIPYIHSDAARVAAWRDRLGKKAKPRVGLAWSGNPGHKNDHNRSLALAELLPLLHDGAEWISLQQEVRANDAALLAQRTDIRHFGAQLNDFAETAALVELMDVVISVDTSVAHLAGAMGKPLWILLPFNPDWRWLLNREDSPWYPTARLFRQPAIDDWTAVIDRVGKELNLWRADLFVVSHTLVNNDNQHPRLRYAPQHRLIERTQDSSPMRIAKSSSKLLIYCIVIGIAAALFVLFF